MKGHFFLGRYEAKGLLGEGGMGKVYLAYDHNLKRNVVVKVMHNEIASDPKFRERFEAEKLLTAQFEHTYAVRVYDASYDDTEGPCIVMEYIRGVTLEKLLVQNMGRLHAARVSRLLDQLCEVLQAAHNQRIIHRDLKPANIMVVEPDTPFEKVKVMDFGLAVLRKPPQTPGRRDDADKDSRAREYAVGTPTYMCPEQIKGEELDHRSDLYSLGVILYELLTGRLPFQGTEAMDVLLAHATELPPTFAEVGVDEIVPPGVETVVRSCLAKDRTQRPASALELAERFRWALERGVSPFQEIRVPLSKPVHRSPSPPPPPPSPVQVDPNAVVQVLEAFMPETIAIHKLRGFVQDKCGEILESVPGRIRVRLGHRSKSPYARGGGPLSWLGIGKKPSVVDLELCLEPADPERKGLLRIVMSMRSPNGEKPSNPFWRARCNQVYVDLRAYLMGQAGDAG